MKNEVTLHNLNELLFKLDDVVHSLEVNEDFFHAGMCTQTIFEVECAVENLLEI